MSQLIAPFGHICAVIADLDPVPFGGLRLRSASFGTEFMGLRSMGPQIEKHGTILTQISHLIDEARLSDLSAQRLSPINADTLRRAHKLAEQGGQGGQGNVTISQWPYERRSPATAVSRGSWADNPDSTAGFPESS
mgnify:CR=1 FL=1